MMTYDINEALEYIAGATHAIGAFDEETGEIVEVFFFSHFPTEEDFDNLAEYIDDEDDLLGDGGNYVIQLVNPEDFPDLKKVVAEGMSSQKRTLN
jgi:hypothetical protein